MSRTILTLLVVLASGESFATKPPEGEPVLFIVRAKSGQLKNVAARNNLTVIEWVEDPDGDDVVLVSMNAIGPLEHAAAALVAREASVIKNAEPVVKARLPEIAAAAAIAQSPSALLDAVSEEGTASVGTEPDGSARELWSGYADQSAARLVRLAAGQQQGLGAGAVIAVIDSAIDTLHPVLADHVIDGWDFLQESASTSSLRATVDQSTMAILDQSTMAILDQRTRAVLRGAGDVEAVAVDDSTAALFEAGSSDGLGDLGAAFGHGTMVAGIVHLVAPEARIMPLRAFDADGYASTFDLIQAIRYAVREGATVINLSFSLESESKELESAIQYAVRRGVICVPAAGNDGIHALVYPAAFPETIGVAATDLDDFVAAFSNFGNDLVKLAAPGVSIITTYPGGGWAAGSGTSFATPWISGAVALLAERAARGGVDLDLARALDALSHGAAVQGSLALDVGFGRLDVESAGAHLKLTPANGGGSP